MRTESFDVFLPAFGLHSPDQQFPLQEQNVHPLSVTTEKGLDLDLSALMAFDRLIIDSGARAHIMDKRRSYLRPMRDTLVALESEDLTVTRDFGDEGKILQPLVDLKTDILIEDIDYWRPKAAEHWHIYQSMLPPLLDQYKGHCDLEQEKLHFGVYCYLRKRSDKIDISEGQRLNQFVASKAKLKNQLDRDLFKELIRPLVRHTVLNTLLREKLHSPFIDWDDLNVYYTGIDRLQVSADGEKKRAHDMIVRSREVFSVALPELRPKDVAAFIKFRKTSDAFRSFQEQVLNAVRSGTRFDQKWAQQLRSDAVKALRIEKRRTRKLKLILAPFKIVLPRIAAGGELLKGALSLIEGGAERAYASGTLKFEWYYTLLEISSA
jgi:hypothetical protein